MKISCLWIILLLIALPIPTGAQDSNGVTTIQSVEPGSGRAGDVLKANGVYLDRNSVLALYLTDGSNDIKVVIVDQSATALRFRIPTEAKPGRFNLMVLIGRGGNQKLLEQPVKVTVLPRSTTVT